MLDLIRLQAEISVCLARMQLKSVFNAQIQLFVQNANFPTYWDPPINVLNVNFRLSITTMELA